MSHWRWPSTYVGRIRDNGWGSLWKLELVIVDCLRQKRHLSQTILPSNESTPTHHDCVSWAINQLKAGGVSFRVKKTCTSRQVTDDWTVRLQVRGGGRKQRGKGWGKDNLKRDGHGTGPSTISGDTQSMRLLTVVKTSPLFVMCSAFFLARHYTFPLPSHKRGDEAVLAQSIQWFLHGDETLFVLFAEPPVERTTGLPVISACCACTGLGRAL